MLENLMLKLLVLSLTFNLALSIISFVLVVAIAITTYKKNRFVKIPYYKNVIVNEDLLYYFLAKTVYGGLQKDDINDKKYAVMKDYLNRYLTDNQDNIDSDDNITISTINTYMSESTKIFSVSDFRKVVNGNNMTLKKS